jgi:putative SOS response-associated peptidase YedK
MAGARSARVNVGAASNAATRRPGPGVPGDPPGRCGARHGVGPVGYEKGMCGRMTIRTPAQDIARELGLDGVQAALEQPRYNLAPTQQVPAVVNDGARQLTLLRWGLVPGWARDVAIGNKLINARAETVADKPSFRTALRRRRCIVVADGFYEWMQSARPKRPFLFQRRDGRPFAIAGLWEEWHPPDGSAPLRTCTLVTTQANALLAPYHERMPVLLEREAWECWLTPGALEPAQLKSLLVPAPVEGYHAHEVSRVVNLPAHDGPECVAPLAG